MLVKTFYDYNFVGKVTEDNSDEEDEMSIGSLSDSHLMLTSSSKAMVILLKHLLRKTILTRV